MKNKFSIALLAILVLAVESASAHRGRRDSNGGHIDRATGIYRCHTDDCVLPIVTDEDEDVVDPPDGGDTEPLTIAGSWGAVKEWARDDIYAGENVMFYSGCSYTPSGRTGGDMDQASCDYDGSDETHSARASRLEWEHVVPASLVPAHQFACWNEGLQQCSEGGRECFEKEDLNARAQIFDRHNLVPSVGQANAFRSKKRYGLIDGEDRDAGVCDFEWTEELAERADSIRSDVAWIWLYFVDKHGLQLQDGELQMFMERSENDPLDASEFMRNDRIREQQGNGNPFVEMSQ